MENWGERLFENWGEEISEFMFSDLELGIIQNEVGNKTKKESTDLIVFDKLEMILELNNLLYYN